MKLVPLHEAKNGLSEFVKAASHAPVVITVHGRPMAALVAIEDEDVESILLGFHPRFTALLDRAHATARERGTTPLSEIEREVAHREREAIRNGREGPSWRPKDYSGRVRDTVEHLSQLCDSVKSLRREAGTSALMIKLKHPMVKIVEYMPRKDTFCKVAHTLRLTGAREGLINAYARAIDRYNRRECDATVVLDEAREILRVL